MNSKSPRSDRKRCGPMTPAVDAGLVSHLHVNDASLIPAVWRAPNSFSVLRLESECGMADRITKLASAPALLVSVSIKSLAIADYRLWVDDKLVSTPSIHGFRGRLSDGLHASGRGRGPRVVAIDEEHPSAPRPRRLVESAERGLPAAAPWCAPAPAVCPAAE